MREPCSCGAGCACGCCEGAEPLTPLPIANRPGLDALAYRVGTHASFLETMQARLTTPGLAGLTTRERSDPSLALLDAWAVLADVLTFYQERIANEGYLRTATERRSVVELARLVGYAPRPGVAASTFLAYSLDEGPETVIPAGAAVRSVPGPGELPQTFETSAELTARAAWNDLLVRLTRPQQPEKLTDKDWTREPRFVPLYLAGITTGLQANDPLLIDTRGDGSAPELFRILAVAPEAEKDRTRVDVQPWLMPPPAPAPPPGSAATTTELKKVLGSLSKRTVPQPPTSARLDRDAATLLAPESDLAAQMLAAARPALRDVLFKAWANVPVTEQPTLRVFALRLRAAVFGHNAPLEPVRGEGGVIIGSKEWDLKGGGSGGSGSVTETFSFTLRPSLDDTTRRHQLEEQHDGLIAKILPPMRDAFGFGDYFARLVHDRHCAVAGDILRLALDDVNDVRPVAVAVPWHGATGLDHELAHAKEAILDVLLLLYVDHGDDSVGDADRLQVYGLAGVGLGLVCGAFAGLSGGQRHEARAERGAGKQDIAAEPAFRFELKHLRLLLLVRASAERNGRCRSLGRIGPNASCNGNAGWLLTR